MARIGKAGETLKDAADQTSDQTADGADQARAAARSGPGPRPSPLTTMILADVVLRGGGALLRRAVDKHLLGRKAGKGTADPIIKGRSIGQTLLGTAVARIATRSVPGALLVGGGLLAKAIYDRKKGKEGKEGKERPKSRCGSS